MSLPLSHAGGSVDGISAALDLRFASSLSLTSTSGITPSFSRASTGTFFNSSGVLTSAAINAPRFNHVYNGSSWVSKGLLVEEQRTNLCTYSSNQLNAAWVPFNSTITASGETDPVGGTSAFRIAETTTSNQRHIAYNTITPSASTFTYSVFAKAQERNWLQLISYDDPNIYYTWFDLSAGVIGTNAAGNTATITAVGNGWYRCSVTRTVASTVAQFFQAGPANGDNNTAYAGDPTKGLLIYGAQVETGSFPTSYIPTTTAAVTRSADVCQITGGDFSGFWNASEGSVAVEFDQLADASKMTNESYIYGFQNAADAEQFILRGQSSGVYYWRSVNSGNVDATAQISSLGTSTVKHAACYKVNDFASTFNGAAVVSDTSGATPIPTTLGIGFNWPSGGNRINGHIARLRYFNKRLTNTKLRFLSGGPKSFRPDEIVGLQFWIDASDSSTLYTDSTLTTLAVSDGDPVGGWKDKSGNSRNALQTDGMKKPMLKLAIHNGQNVVRYDGVNDFSLISTISIAQPYHVFFVTKIRSTGDIFHANGQGQIRTGTAGSILPLTGVAVFCGATLASTNFFVNDTVLAGQFVANGASSKIYKNGSLVISGNPGTQGITSTMSLASYNTGSDNLNSDFMEVLIFNHELSAANRQLVEAYLNAKWGTP